MLRLQLVVTTFPSIMEKENLTFVCLPAGEVQHPDEDEYDQECLDATHKDSLYAVLEKVQTFFTDHLRVSVNDDSPPCPEYAYNRWPEQKQVLLRVPRSLRSWTIAVSSRRNWKAFRIQGDAPEKRGRQTLSDVP